MATLKKFDFTGKEIGEENIDLLDKKANSQMIKDYIVALRANARQWSANTKGRSEVNKVKQKSQQQKGLGRARHGFMSAPQYKGGGVVFGPKPKFDQYTKRNRKEKRSVIQTMLMDKIEKGSLIVLDGINDNLPKTKLAFDFFKSIESQNKKVLIVGNNVNEFANLIKSIRNIPKKYYTYVSKLNGYQLAHVDLVIVLKSAFDDFSNLLKDKAGTNEA